MLTSWKYPRDSTSKAGRMTSRRTRQRPSRAQQRIKQPPNARPFNKVLYWRAGAVEGDSHRDRRYRGGRRSVLTELLGVQVLVLLVVRGLGKADGGIAVALADEGLAGFVFAWRRARGKA